MDRIPTNTIYKERQVFISKLKSNPIFLFRHVGSFSEIIWRRCWARLLTKLRGRHRGQKQRPRWLNQLNKFQQSKTLDLNDLLKQVIERELTVNNSSQPVSDYEYGESDDPEDYLLQNRWAILFHDLLRMRCIDKDAITLPASIKNWLDNPPPKLDLAWETYSTCERVANLLTWISFIPMDERSRVVPPTIVKHLQESIAWIATHLEYYGKQTGNHIINNARALIMVGAFLKNKIALHTGMEMLKRMLPVLIQADGFLRERSSHYQLIVLTWLLDAFTFAKHCNMCTDTEIAFLQETIKRMGQAASMLCDPQGNLQVYIGDISPDMTPADTTRRLTLCYPNDWPAQMNRVNSDDWHSIKNQSNKVLLNCPNGRFPKQFPSHAHGDITSFVWSYEDKPIFIDPGRSRYTKDPISSLQKSAASHNVALVNNLAPLCESFVLNGNWWPIPYASATIHVEQNENSITLAHDGFKRATPVNKHTRKIEIFADGITVCDHFSGTGSVSITLLWHLHSTFTCFDKNILTIHNGSLAFTIDHADTLPTPQIEFLQLHPEMGWFSTEYGRANNSPVLMMQWKTELPFAANIKFRIKPCVA